MAQDVAKMAQDNPKMTPGRRLGWVPGRILEDPELRPGSVASPPPEVAVVVTNRSAGMQITAKLQSTNELN